VNTPISNPAGGVANDVFIAGRFTGRHALVSGAASGIGRAIALRLAREGAHVRLIDRDQDALEAACSDLPGTGHAHRVVDLADGDATRQAVAWAVADGGGHLDVLVHSAAVSAGGVAPELQPQVWDNVLAVNLTASYHLAAAAVPYLARSDSGALLLVASQLGLVGTRGSVAYTAAKGGVVNLTRSLALDHADDGIRVNCLCPGPTDTPFLRRSFERTADSRAASSAALAAVPLGRFGHVDEIAAAAAFLCSGEASFITGTTLVVDGGYLAQ
jgi:NAD(P)-dependent dehydrogenase (short-subunit alcohol dehydrogenase family)